jgi:hypothetical protein
MPAPAKATSEAPQEPAASASSIHALCSVAAGDYSQQLLVFKGMINDCPARILVDSGANGMFISSDYVNRNDLITSSLAHAMRIRMANGAVQTTNLQVSHVDVRVQGYRDTLSFTVTPIKGYDVIFGKPWLTAHNPVIDWSSNTITSPFHLTGDLAPNPKFVSKSSRLKRC